MRGGKKRSGTKVVSMRVNIHNGNKESATRCLFALVWPVNSKKYFRLSKNVSPSSQPDGCASPRQPVGPSLVIAGRNICLGKMNTGGMLVQEAEMNANMVVFTPRSFETVCWTF